MSAGSETTFNDARKPVKTPASEREQVGTGITPPIRDHAGHTLPDHFRLRMRFSSGDLALVEVRLHPIIVPNGGTATSIAEVAHA
jgi:hypothetical protein